MEINAKFKWTVVFCVAILMLLAAGCNFNRKSDKQQGKNQDIMPIDSVFTASADSVNPVWSHKLDSMLRVAATAKQDTNLAKLYYDIAGIYFNDNYEKAKAYFLKSKDLSEKLDWNKGRYLFAAGNYCNILEREGLIDSAIVIQQKALEIAKRETNDYWIGQILSNIGISYFYKNWNKTALDYYNEALPLYEKQSDKYKLANLYHLIGTVYGNMEMFDEEISYSEKALDILNEKPDTILRAYPLIGYACALIMKQQLDKAENNLLEAKRISTLNNNKSLLLSIYYFLSAIAERKYDLNMAEMYSLKVLEIATELNDRINYCNSCESLGEIEMFKGNFNQAEEYARKALETADKYDILGGKENIYLLFSYLLAARHDFRNHLPYVMKADSIKNILTSEQTMEYAKEMEAKYESEKKELKITALEKEKQLMIWLSIAGGAVLLLAMAAFFFLWRWTIQKRKLAENKNKQLEQEKQLVATQAVLDGETQERSRLARDLHDGLGSMLTGVKLNLMEMKKGVKLEYPDVERFDKALGLLDNSVQEMRRIAHHLMPDSLSRFGLKPAVEDFCRSFAPTVVFDYFGDKTRLDPLIEIVVYRSIYELVNNALKYSGASQILVQIMQESNRIAFTVQDDGCGFDLSAETKGTGLQNIRDRIASYNGVINIDSKAGEGTEVNIELKWKQD